MSHKVILKDAFKGYTLDQDKICTPEETVRRFKNALETIGTKKQMGKGGTPHQSEASAVMELVDWFYMINHRFSQ